MRKPAKTIVSIAALVAAAWAFFSVVSAMRPAAEGAAGAVSAPFGRFFAFFSRSVKVAWRSATAGVRAGAECEALRRENGRLAAEAAGADALRAENAALRRALAFAGRGRSLVAAEVVSDGGASGWTGELRIDRGRRDGVEAGAPVIAPEGFVGRVVSVSERTAKVLPATDPNCRLSCVVEGLEKAGHGILSGGGNARPAPEIAMLHVVEPLEVAFIDKDTPVKPGARVFTAGDGTAYPRGILVGTVIGVDRDSTLLFQRARVRPAVPFHALGPVFVLKRGDSGPASGGGAREGGE